VCCRDDGTYNIRYDDGEVWLLAKAALSSPLLVVYWPAWNFLPQSSWRSNPEGAPLDFPVLLWAVFADRTVPASGIVAGRSPFLRPVSFLLAGFSLVALALASSPCQLLILPAVFAAFRRTLQVDHLVRRRDIFEEENPPQGAPKPPPAGGHEGVRSLRRPPLKRLRRLSQVYAGELSLPSPSSPPPEELAAAGSASSPTPSDAVSLPPDASRRADIKTKVAACRPPTRSRSGAKESVVHRTILSLTAWAPCFSTRVICFNPHVQQLCGPNTNPLPLCSRRTTRSCGAPSTLVRTATSLRPAPTTTSPDG